jgi:hypothetical protein
VTKRDNREEIGERKKSEREERERREGENKSNNSCWIVMKCGARRAKGGRARKARASFITIIREKSATGLGEEDVGAVAG